MAATTSPTQSLPKGERFIDDLKQLVQVQQESIAALKLSAYAVDATRVLTVFDRHADMSKAFDDMLKTVCPDWRNPGSIDQPADLIADVLAHAIAALQTVQNDLERLAMSTQLAGCSIKDAPCGK